MAVTVTELASINHHTGKMVVANLLFDSSYPTGGEAITAADFGMQAITHAVALNTDDILYRAVVVNGTNLVKLYEEDATSGKEAEESSTGDASAINATLLVFGV